MFCALCAALPNTEKMARKTVFHAPYLHGDLFINLFIVHTKFAMAPRNIPGKADDSIDALIYVCYFTKVLGVAFTKR
jgi:hypothetical protein